MSASIYFELCKIKLGVGAGKQGNLRFGAKLFKLLDEKYDFPKVFSNFEMKVFEISQSQSPFLKTNEYFYFSFCSKYSPKIEIFNTIH